MHFTIECSVCGAHMGTKGLGKTPSIELLRHVKEEIEKKGKCVSHSICGNCYEPYMRSQMR